MQAEPGDLGRAAHVALAQARYREAYPGQAFTITASQQDHALATLQGNKDYKPEASLSHLGALSQWQAATRFYEAGGNHDTSLAPFLKAMDDKALTANHGDATLASLNLAHFFAQPSFLNSVLAQHDGPGAELYMAAQRVMVTGEQ